MSRKQPIAGGGTGLGRFLRARLTRLIPGEAGVDYRTRLERGEKTRPRPSVVDALARALRLAADERYEVKWRAAGHKSCHHPEVGTFTPGYQTRHLEGTQGQRLNAYYAEPGTPGYDARVLLDLAAHEHAGKPATQQR